MSTSAGGSAKTCGGRGSNRADAVAVSRSPHGKIQSNHRSDRRTRKTRKPFNPGAVPPTERQRGRTLPCPVVGPPIASTTADREGEMMTDDPPPEGGKAAKLMWGALDEELRREVEEEGQVIETRHLIVRRLTAKALAGDIQAIKEIFDRMEGKSASDATPDEGRRKLTFEWKDDDDAKRADAGGSSSPSANDDSASLES
jgi:hypothetical protein